MKLYYVKNNVNNNSDITIYQNSNQEYFEKNLYHSIEKLIKLHPNCNYIRKKFNDLESLKSLKCIFVSLKILLFYNLSEIFEKTNVLVKKNNELLLLYNINPEKEIKEFEIINEKNNFIYNRKEIFIIQELTKEKTKNIKTGSGQVPKYAPKRKKKDIEQKIPMTIMQTHKTDIRDKITYDNIMEIIEMNPDYEYKFFDDEDCKNFIKDYMGDRYLRAFNDLRHGPFRSDYFRYIYLFVKGGVYMDTDFKEFIPLSEFIRTYDEFVSVKDISKLGIYNAFMACVPNHPVLAEMIEFSTNAIEKRMKFREALELTGPIGLGKCFVKVYNRDNVVSIPEKFIKILPVKFVGLGKGYIYNRNGILFQTKPKACYAISGSHLHANLTDRVYRDNKKVYDDEIKED
jgi:mannosyltransferase OCH1-like enzyme